LDYYKKKYNFKTKDYGDGDLGDHKTPDERRRLKYSGTIGKKMAQLRMVAGVDGY
jgi:hypothetical protein